MSDSMPFNRHLRIDHNGKTYRHYKGQLNLRWTVKETIGVAIVNPRGLARAKKSVIIA